MSTTPEQFVRVWMAAKVQGKTTHWVADTLNSSYGTVYARASLLRKKGVNLPRLTSIRPARLDINSLNELISSFEEK
jgi:transposase